MSYVKLYPAVLRWARVGSGSGRTAGLSRCAHHRTTMRWRQRWPDGCGPPLPFLLECDRCRAALRGVPGCVFGADRHCVLARLECLAPREPALEADLVEPGPARHGEFAAGVGDRAALAAAPVQHAAPTLL